MASGKATGSSYAIRFNVSSVRDSSDDDDEGNDEEGKEESATFTDPLLAASLGDGILLEQWPKKTKKKKVDVVKLESEVDKKHSDEKIARNGTAPTDGVQCDAEAPTGKPFKPKGSLIKPLTALRKKQSSSLITQAQSAPASELSSPTTSSKRQHVPSGFQVPSVSGKDRAEGEKESKTSLSTSSDASINSNANNCNNKEDVFSLFSGLKDKLGRFSAESREILDRKVFKSGSVDMPKITSMFAAGSPVEGELLAEEAKEETFYEVSPLPKGTAEKTSLEATKRSSLDSSFDMLETEMMEISHRNSLEEEDSQLNNFDIGRLMKLVHSDSSKKLAARDGCDEEKKSLRDDRDEAKADEGSLLDSSMTPSDILSHEAAVDAFRSTAGVLLDPGTKRLPEGGRSKSAKKSAGSPVQKNPFANEKKESMSKSSSISMTLSSLLSRQKSSPKLPVAISQEAIVMTSKVEEAKTESAVGEATSVSGDAGATNNVQGATADAADYILIQDSSWFLKKYFEKAKRKVSSKIFLILFLVVAWCLVPLSPYAAGVVAGAVGSLAVVRGVNVFQKLFSNNRVDTGSLAAAAAEFASSVCEDELMDVRESKNVDGSFKGWLNELGGGSTNSSKPTYDPRDYHINSTHSVYVTLEGTNLRLQTPRLSMPKRALWSDESPASVAFVKQRHYDLLGAKVSLLPESLVSKRLWSKKYPINIEIYKVAPPPAPTLRSRSNATKLSSQASKVEDTTSEQTRTSQAADDAISTQPSLPPRSTQPNVTTKVLYLFARTSREKEEWFRRLKAASLDHPWPTRFSDIAKNLGANPSVKRKMHRRAASQPNKKSIMGTDDFAQEVLDVRNDATNPDDAVVASERTPPNMIDYSTLMPETNLLYYAKYMARVMGRNVSNPEVESSPKSPDSNKAPASTEKEGLGKRSSSTGGNISTTRNKETPKSDCGGKSEKKDEVSDATAVQGKPPEEDVCDPQLLWLNTLISRCFMDFLREKYWVEKIREKIQKKLSKIHIPFIMDQLSVTGIDLGPSVPTICRASRPYLDDRGFWVDLKVSYPGGFCITMETKCNLMKLKHSTPSRRADGQGTQEGADAPGRSIDSEIHKRSAALYSDEEDSAESSTDEESRLFEEDLEDAGEDKKATQPIGKRLLRLVDKISQSRYFQQATEYKYIRRAIEEVSNTRLELNVEVKSLVGTLTLNVPPPPTDRLWYGFRGNPQFDMVARPRVGVREVSLGPVTEWIEKKLAVEFQRVFVMPNMDDLKIPLMLDHMIPT